MTLFWAQKSVQGLILQGSIFMVVQRPAQAVLRQFGIFMTLKLALPICVVLWCQTQCALCTGGRLIRMRQRKVSSWYFGGKWVTLLHIGDFTNKKTQKKYLEQMRNNNGVIKTWITILIRHTPTRRCFELALKICFMWLHQEYQKSSLYLFIHEYGWFVLYLVSTDA